VLDMWATHTTSMQPARPCSNLTAASSARLAGADPSYPATMCRNPPDGAAYALSARGSHLQVLLHCLLQIRVVHGNASSVW
jgi:hypothetical protein